MKIKNTEIMLREKIPLVSILLIFIMVAISYFHYKNEKQEVLKTEYKELAYNTHLKADRLITCVDQYITNAESYSFSPFFVQAIDNFFNNHSVKLKKTILRRIQAIRNFKKNENIIITDTTGNIRISLDERITKLDSLSKLLIKKTLVSRKGLLGEFHKCPVTHKFYLDIMSPFINDSGKVIGIMIVRLDPLNELIPIFKNDRLLQEKSCLITMIDNRLFILNDSTILTPTDKSITNAILHYNDKYQGIDENQNKTIEHIEPIKNTNWFLITRISYDEAIKTYNPYAKIILFINGLIFFILLISIAFIFSYRQKTIYKSLLRSEVANLENEVALRESEEKFKQMFLTIPDAILINRFQDQIFVEINDSFTSLSGFSKEEVIGKTALDINIWNNPNDRKKLFACLAAFGYCENFETCFRRKDGTVFTATISARKINLNGVQHVISIVHDITSRKLMEDELLKAKNKAEESDRLKTSFINNISHEIRTPMNGIVGFANLLKNKKIKDQDRSDYVDIIIQSAYQLLSVVDDVLQISRIESGIVTLQNTTFNVNDLLKQVYYLFLSKINVDFSYNCGLDECFIESDKEKIKQILSVLINNSIKFTPTGEIKFDYKINDTFIEFSVQDTGIGIPSDEQNRIFKRFYQIDNEFTRKYGGNGLGLNIAKKLVELLNGKIWLDTQYNKGSRFCFSIPYKYLEPSSLSEKNTIFDFTNLIILVADDEQTNLNFLKILLSMKGASVITANNGSETVQAVQQNKTDLILMDLKMPVMDGLEATRQIKKLFPHLPIIAQTAYSMQEEKEQALAAGCISFVTKPIRAESLFSEINRVLNIK